MSGDRDEPEGEGRSASTPSLDPTVANVAEADGASGRTSRRRRFRSSLSVVVGVLACLGLLTSMVGVWTYRTVFNEDAWVERIASLPINPEVADALATRLTDELFSNAAVQERVAAALPDRAAPIAAPVTEAAKTLTYNAMYRILQSEQFHVVWIAANRAVHQRVVAILRGDQSGRLVAGDGTVSLNLLPLISKALTTVHNVAPDLIGNGVPPTIDATTPVDVAREQLSAYLGRPLPPEFGTVVVFQSDQLAAAQTAVRVVTGILIVLLVATIGLFAGAVLLARRRLRATMFLGVGALATVAALWAIGRAVGNQLIGSLDGDKSRAAARETIATVFDSLRSLSLWVIAAAVLVTVVAFIAGDNRLAAALRVLVARLFSSQRSRPATPPPSAAWINTHRIGLQLVGVAVGLILLAVLNQTWSVLAVTILGVAVYETAVVAVASVGSPPGVKGHPVPT